MYKRKLRILQVFVCTAILTSIVIFVIVPAKGPLKFKTDSIYNDKARNLSIDVVEFERLTDTITKYIDTPFFAQYRIKSNTFYFNYLLGESVGNSFVLSSEVEKKVFGIAKNMQIRRIWNFSTDNFFRFEIQNNKEQNKILIVLQTGQDTVRSAELGNISIANFEGGNSVRVNNFKEMWQLTSRSFLLSIRK